MIDEIGSGVTGFSIGDRVWLWDVAWGGNEGTAQEYAVVPAAKAVALPGTESFDTGASIGIPALTAHRALTSAEDGPPLSPGALSRQTVLVTGGAGAVGHAAIQLAEWAGATVITTVSGDRKAELARLAGAHTVINYRTDDVVAAVRQAAPGGVDTIVEVNAPANTASDVRVLKPSGTIAIYAANPGESVIRRTSATSSSSHTPLRTSRNSTPWPPSPRP